MLSCIHDWHDHCEHYLKYIWNICNISCVRYLRFNTTLLVMEGHQQKKEFENIKSYNILLNTWNLESPLSNNLTTTRPEWPRTHCAVFFCIRITMYEVCSQEPSIVSNTHHNISETVNFLLNLEVSELAKMYFFLLDFQIVNWAYQIFHFLLSSSSNISLTYESWLLPAKQVCEGKCCCLILIKVCWAEAGDVNTNVLSWDQTMRWY